MTSFIFDAKNEEVSANLVKKVKMTLKEKWHRTLGHVNFHYLNKLCQDELLEGLPKELESDYIKCAICIESKMTNLPFENNRKRAKEILEVIHTDINEPHPTAGNCGEKYFLTFIDEYSKLAKVYCIRSKSETYDCFVEYVNLVENISNKRVKNLRCDNGKEYLNSNVYNFIKKKGINMIPCPPYVHELNGVAERYNRSIMDMTRCLLKEAKVNRRFWPEVIQAAPYLKNRTLANTLEKKTPYEIFFNEKPNVKYLKIYGSRVFVRVPEQLRKSKWDDKARLGILLGYTETGYRVLMNNKIINARHVDIIEETVKCIGLSDESEESDTEQSKENEIEENEIEENEVSEISQIDNKNSEGKTPIKNKTRLETENDKTELRRSKRKKNTNSKYVSEDYENNFVYVNYCDSNVPNTYEKALESYDSENWKNAMKTEISSLEKNKT